jgi:hypothetical protein
MLVVAGSLIWPMIKTSMAVAHRQPLLALLFVITAVLNLLAAGVLVFSKKFGAEFAFERKHQPEYKRYLRWSIVAAIVVATVLATINDIVNLASIG